MGLGQVEVCHKKKKLRTPCGHNRVIKVSKEGPKVPLDAQIFGFQSIELSQKRMRV